MDSRHKRRVAEQFPRYAEAQESTRNMFRRHFLEMVPAAIGAVIALPPLVYSTVLLTQKSKGPTKGTPVCDWVSVKRSEEVSQDEAIEKARKMCRLYSSAIEPSHPAIRDLVKNAIRHPGSLSVNQMADVYEYISRKVDYENVFNRLNPYPASRVLKDGRGDCKNMTILLASALLSIGADIKIVFDFKNQHVFVLAKIPNDEIYTFNDNYYKKIIRERYRLPDPLPMVEGMDEQLVGLAKAERKMAESDREYGKFYKMAHKVYEEYQEASKKGNGASGKLERRWQQIRNMSRSIRFEWEYEDKNHALGALRKAMEEKWLWFNGRPARFDTVYAEKDKDDDPWLAMDLTTESYPGRIAPYSPDIVIGFGLPE